MPASDYFTVTGGSYTNYNEHQGSISFQLLGSGNISFKHNFSTHFTVIGGGGGGGGGGHDNGAGSPAYPSGGGGGAGASGKIFFRTNHSESYSYEVGSGGSHGVGNNSGGNGTESSITFSLTEYILAEGGNYGAGHYGGNIGGTGGPLTIQGLDTIINGTSGAGGNGVTIANIAAGTPNDEGTPGTAQNPTSIDINPDISINVGGGGGGANATSLGNPPDPPYQGGRGGNGIGGAVGTNAANPPPTTVSDGEKGQTYGAGGGGGGQPGDGTREGTNSYHISWGGVGGDGAIFVYILDLTNGCEWNPKLTLETTEWTRAHTDCVDISGATVDGQPMTRQDLDEKRKATIFQYKKNSAGFSKKQQYSRIARGLGQKKTTYATQSATYTNPNTNNLVLDASSVLICPGRAKNWAYSSQNDTPGPMIKITNHPNVPLTNYKVRRTYLAGNNKWPQLGPLEPNLSSSSSPSPSSLSLPTVEINTPANNSTIYNNRIQIDYVTANFVNDYYIEVIAMINNEVQINQNGKIYPTSSLVFSSAYLNVDEDIRNYNIKIQAYHSNGQKFTATDQITVNVLVPTISIIDPLNDATINSNVFDLSYDVTNLGDNKIVLYNGNTLIDDNVTTNPYQVKVDTSHSYDFKLQIVNDITAPSPNIISEITNIKMEIPTVEITSPLDHPEVTIDVGKFDLSYNVVNMPASSHLQLYTRNVGDNLWNIMDIDIVTDDTSTSINVPMSSGEGNYEFKLQINNADNTPTTDNPGNYDITAVRTNIIPLLTVHNATKNVIEKWNDNDTELINYTYYYFKQTDSNFTLQYTNIPLSQPIDILLVGGGGAGGNYCNGTGLSAGGGGAGAFVTVELSPINNVSYNITIGNGGAGATGCNNPGGYGGSTYIENINQSNPTTVITAYGGGGGGAYNAYNGAGNIPTDNKSYGSTGGVNTSWAGTSQAMPYPTVYDGIGRGIDNNIENAYTNIRGYVNEGGEGTQGWGGSGGGGAGHTGYKSGSGEDANGNTNPANGGNGGEAKEWFDGKWYAGGGGGVDNVNPGGNGGLGGNSNTTGTRSKKGGAGNGGGGDQSGTKAVANTGGGSGAQGSGPYPNNGGGSGICVIRLLTNSFIQDESSTNIT
tara:strand:- start:82 stop:3435 length:3354 start_codon:yes stop_codon:yes gene_type:complete